ncbi:MAG: hypothetical protein GY856_08070 [bacterium]|nr:hypothetical protein [bacterium]
MILTQIRQDPAMRSLPKLISLTAVNASVLLGLCYFRAGMERQAPELTLLMVVVWLAFAIYQVLGKVRTRSSPFDMALPLPARRLWLTHMLAVLLAGALMIAASLGAVALWHWFAGEMLKMHPGAELEMVDLVVLLSVGLALAVVLLQTPKPGLSEIPFNRRYVLLMVVTLVGVLGVMIVLRALPLPWTLVPLGLAFALGLRSYRSLPAAFTLVPPAADVGDQDRDEIRADRFAAKDQTALTGDRRGYRRILFLTIHRTVKLGPATIWFMFPPLILFGMICAGGLGPWSDLDDLRFLYVPLIIYLLLVFVSQMIRQLSPLDALPISRRLLFALVIVPSLLTLSLGYGAGRIVTAAMEQKEQRIEFLKDESHYFVRVPIGRCEIAWNGRPPASSSPWGESHEAWKTPLFRGSRVVLYSPFSTPEGSSPEFVALQMSRAIAAIYGEHVSPVEINDRYLELRDDGSVGLKEAGFTLLEDYPDLKLRGEGPGFPLLVLALVGLPSLLLLALFLVTYRAGVAERVRTSVLGALAGLMLALMAGQVVAAVMDFMEPRVARGFLEILIRQMGETVPGTLAAWGGSALVFAGGYWLAQARFQGIELPAEPLARKEFF